MEKHDWIELLAIFGKWIVALVTSMWVATDADMRALAMLLAIDLVTCLFNPEKELRKNITRTAVTVIMVLTVHWAYSLAVQQTGLNLGFNLSTVVCSFYLLGEAIRIVRNCSIWIDIPQPLLDVLEKAEGLTGKQKKALHDVRAAQEVAEKSLHQAQKATDVLEETLPKKGDV